ncbi:MAG: inositol monophosphatase [Candidatus Pristimantibacillus sp.]
MDTAIIPNAQLVAIEAVLEAGKLAKERFDLLEQIEEKDSFGDVVTEVDYLMEAIILNKIQEQFPNHQIHSEEAGDNGMNSEWLWMIDPLDGTNNYAIGLPIFSTSITLMYDRKPVLGVIYEPMTDRLYRAALRESAYCNDKPILVKKKDDIRKANIGWVQGHKVQKEDRAMRLRHYLESNVKRLMRLWAPTIQWNMLAKGDIDGIIVYNSEGDDLYSGILMVREAGGVVVDFQGNDFNEMCEEPYLIACHPDYKTYFLNLVNEGLMQAE